MLQPDDFVRFFREIHGHSPFPWQKELPRQIIETNSWPSLIDVPTGLGKTSMLDVAVFMAAMDADRPGNERLGRRRIFFVVDRRIVVDQAAHHAGRIARGLSAAEPGTVAAEVAARLRTLADLPPTDDPLKVVRMRGGATWDSSWLPRPDVPGIVTGTVDQVGSRLLFRGYGVSPRRRSIDAALVGTDSLIFVDEAHLATALTTTLNTAMQIDSPTRMLGVPRPWVTLLTATGDSRNAGWAPVFNETAHLLDAVAEKRITAKKRLRMLTTTKASAVRVLTETAAQAAARPGARVLVVCNTIDRARQVHGELTKLLPEHLQPLLLIGRSRQYEREEVVDRVLDLFSPERRDSQDGAVLVATQTVEVGVDLDATTLVTESTSWDSLVQRLGRVNRRGEREGEVIIVHDDDPKPPIYGAARIATAAHLQEALAEAQGDLDVCPLALRQMAPPLETQLVRTPAPCLLPAHLDAWVRTSPAPVNDAPLDAYLHGIDRGVAPVSLAWRDGLLLNDGSPVSTRGAELNSLLNAVPVRTEETVEVPLVAARRWLAGDRPLPVSDWDDLEDWAPFGDDNDRQALRQETLADGSVTWRWVSASGIRPGDLLVVPTEFGGLDAYGWNPTSQARVRDVAELAAIDRGQPILRLDDSLPFRLALDSPPPQLSDLVRLWQVTDDPSTRDELSAQSVKLVRAWLEDGRPTTPGPWDQRIGDSDSRRQRLAKAIQAGGLYAVAPTGKTRHSEPSLTPLAVVRPAARTTASWREASDDTTDGSAHLLRRVGLGRHGQAVGHRAAEISRSLRLPEELERAVGDAARWHDVGKADPRFQAMLFEGDAVRASLAEEPLAKSGMPPGDLRRHQDARRRSGLPSGARHEAWSHELVAGHIAGLDTPYPGDADLVLHLVASHHGYARPLLPAVVDNGEHTLEADVDGNRCIVELPKGVDLDHAQRFHELNRRYGRWGLALLEAIVRCADMTVSGEGS